MFRALLSDAEVAAIAVEGNATTTIRAALVAFGHADPDPNDEVAT